MLADHRSPCDDDDYDDDDDDDDVSMQKNHTILVSLKCLYISNTSLDAKKYL